MAEPDEKSILDVCEFTGLNPIIDRELVVSALKNKGGNIETVVAAFYDDEAKFRQTFQWDETPFLGSRDGGNDIPDLPKFNIHGPDESTVIHGMSPNSLHPIAPSRPPSRTQSPLGKMVDWQTQSTIGDSSLSQMQEDTDLQRALAASVAMSNLHTPQDAASKSNETDTSLPIFGPANRSSYDPDQWALVRAAPENLEPEPSGRKRAPGAPAFLRCRSPRWDSHNLNAILSILHAIPGVRNAFLNAGVPAPSYGQNSEWWKGSPINLLGASAGQDITLRINDNPASSSGPEDRTLCQPSSELSGIASNREFTDELHRLMAFLDSTDRAYGTADILATMQTGIESWDADLDRRFFSTLKEMGAPDAVEKLCTDVRVLRVESLGSPLDEESFAILDIKYDSRQVIGGLRDMYSVLDAVYWADLLTSPGFDSDDPPKMATVTRAAKVQIFRFAIENLQKPLEVPKTLFLDRYLDENKHLALDIQRRLCRVYEAIKQSERVRDEIVTYRDETDGNRLDRQVLSREAIELALQKYWQLKAASIWHLYEKSLKSEKPLDYNISDIESFELTDPDELAVARAIQAEIAVHKKALAKIEQQLKKLNAEREACENLLVQLKRRYTEPCEADEWAPKAIYRLQGVIVSVETFYVCKFDNGVSEETDAPSKGESQWWKITCNQNAAEQVQLEKTTVEAAQRAAFHDGKQQPILVYAMDAVLKESPTVLSDALRTFVRFDNRFFKQEVSEESPRERKRLPTDAPTSPPKRQQRSNSVDSMATNKASIGELSDRDMNEMPPLVDSFAIDDTAGLSPPPPPHPSFSSQPSFSQLSQARQFTGGKDVSKEAPRQVTTKGSNEWAGEEMVELANSGPSGMRSVGQMSLDGAGRRASSNTSSSSSSEIGGGARLDGRPSAATPAPLAREIPILADWDNPEGRYVGPSYEDSSKN